jgi:hypothetical protein
MIGLPGKGRPTTAIGGYGDTAQLFNMIISSNALPRRQIFVSAFMELFLFVVSQRELKQTDSFCPDLL